MTVRSKEISLKYESDYVKCKKEECAIWNKYTKRCGLIARKL